MILFQIYIDASLYYLFSFSKLREKLGLKPLQVGNDTGAYYSSNFLINYFSHSRVCWKFVNIMRLFLFR